MTIDDLENCANCKYIAKKHDYDDVYICLCEKNKLNNKLQDADMDAVCSNWQWDKLSMKVRIKTTEYHNYYELHFLIRLQIGIAKLLLRIIDYLLMKLRVEDERI